MGYTRDCMSANNISRGFKATIPLRDMIINRNYSLNEKADYATNVLPYRKQGFIIEPQGVHQYGYYQVRSWRVLYSGSNRY